MPDYEVLYLSKGVTVPPCILLLCLPSSVFLTEALLFPPEWPRHPCRQGDKEDVAFSLDQKFTSN